MWLHNQCKEVRTVRQAMKSKTPTIADMAREGGEDKTQAIIELELLKLNNRLRLKNPLTEFDVEFIAEELTKGKNRSLKLADISLILDNICRGKYGELYERINSSKIISIVEEYWEERMGLAEVITQSEHNILSSDQPDLRNKTEMQIGEMFNNARINRMIRFYTEKERKEKEEEDRKAYLAYKRELIMKSHNE